MSIHKHKEKVKQIIASRSVCFAVLAISFALWGAGWFFIGSVAFLSKKEPIVIEYPPLVPVSLTSNLNSREGEIQASEGNLGAFLASKNGTKYYPKDCGGASRIKEENRVWFAIEDEAKAAGYERASGC